MAVSRILTAFLIAGFALPASLSAATFEQSRTVVISASPTQNAYLAGTDVSVAAAVPGDVLAAGGTVRIVAPVAQDIMLAGGTVRVEEPIGGDARVVGGFVSVLAPVAGDLVLAGNTVVASSSARDIRAVGGTVRIRGGGGDVSVVGATVELSGVFAGDVRVVASDKLTLAEDTVIQGALSYDAPQQIDIPEGAVVGAVQYTGSSSFLPTAEQARTFAIAGAGVFFLVRILSVLIAAALLAGLFPLLTQRVTEYALTRTPGRFPLLVLLGFGVVVATPVLVAVLFLSFVGSAAGVLLLIAYLLMLILGYLYAGILAGGLIGQTARKGTGVSWRLALLGMLVFFLAGSIPFIGAVITLVLFLAAVGALSSVGFRSAFSRFLPERSSEDTITTT